MTQITTEGTHGLVGLLFWAFLLRILLISNPPLLQRQEMDSGPLRIKNVTSLSKVCRSLCWSSLAGHHQRYWPLPALLDLCTLLGLGYHGCSELFMVFCNLALLQVHGWYHERESGPREGVRWPRSAPAVGHEFWRGQQKKGYQGVAGKMITMPCSCSAQSCSETEENNTSPTRRG